MLSLILASGLLLGSMACTRTETDNKIEATASEVSNEGEDAYKNFKAYVDDVFSDTTMVEYTADRDWNREVTTRETAYNERVAEVDKYIRTYDQARQDEVREMKDRYKAYWDSRRNQYQAYSYRTEMRGKLLGIDGTDQALASVTPTGIRNTYENFVKQVENNKDNYTEQDWEIVDQTWQELDARKNMVQGQLSDKDKYEIGKAKTKYVAMKAASKAGNAAEEGGSAIKKGAKAVEKGAKKAGSEVKETYKDVKD